MKNSEIKHILAKIDRYEKWAIEEETEARSAANPDERDLHLMQARLHLCAADTLHLLLDELQVLAG